MQDDKAPVREYTGEFFEELVAGTEVGQKLRSCLRCGTCTASCPVAGYTELGLRDIVRQVLIGGGQEVLRPEVLYYCSACYSCAVRCPMGIRLTKLVNFLRDVMVAPSAGPLAAQMELVNSVENYDNPWQMPRAQRDRWAKKLASKLKVLPKQSAEALYCAVSKNRRLKIGMSEGGGPVLDRRHHVDKGVRPRSATLLRQIMVGHDALERALTPVRCSRSAGAESP